MCSLLIVEPEISTGELKRKEICAQRINDVPRGTTRSSHGDVRVQWLSRPFLSQENESTFLT